MINIAIDGPSGAGKSTVARSIAAKLHIIYLDTGAMYRGMAWLALNKGIDPKDDKGVLSMLPLAELRIEYVDGSQKVYADGVDVTEKIREHHMSQAASDISKIPAVRLKLVDMQREIAESRDVVMDGRDTTSYVLPNANYKFYLDAHPKVRAARRQAELKAKGVDISLEQMLSDIIARDKNDSERSFAPLKRTEDSVYLDSTDLSRDEVVDLILSYIK